MMVLLAPHMTQTCKPAQVPMFHSVDVLQKHERTAGWRLHAKLTCRTSGCQQHQQTNSKSAFQMPPHSTEVVTPPNKQCSHFCHLASKTDCGVLLTCNMQYQTSQVTSRCMSGACVLGRRAGCAESFTSSHERI